MHAHPLVLCQQLDDWQRLPGQGILETGQDVLLAHQLRGKHSSPLGLGPEPRAAPTTLRGKGPPRPGAEATVLAKGHTGRAPAPNPAPQSGGPAGGAGPAEGAPRPSRTREGAAGQALPTEALPSPRVSTEQARQSGGRRGSAQRGPWSPQGPTAPCAPSAIGRCRDCRVPPPPAEMAAPPRGRPRHRLPSGGRSSAPASSLRARSG